MRRLGVHTSIAGGLHLSLKRAEGLGCNTVQIFSHNPRGWDRRPLKEDEVRRFRELAAALDIRPVFIHSSYLVNLASPDRGVRRRSIELLTHELRTAGLLGADYLVLHPGRAVGQDIGTAIRKASEALTVSYDKAGGGTGLLLENTAGQRGDISSTIPLIAEIIAGTPPGCIRGVCLDTCHAYAAGYDIGDIKVLEGLEREIKEYLNPLRVELIHLNDSRRPLASGVDRHEHIGEGGIGLAGFRRFLSFPLFRETPLILETPKESDRDDIRNLDRVRKILARLDTLPQRTRKY